MPSSRSSATRARACAGALATVVVLAGCGGGNVKSAKAEQEFNAELKTQGLPVRVDCPEEISTSKEFNCEVTSVNNDATRTMKFELQGRDDEALDVTDKQEFEKALLASGS